jgi:glycosyltransferase involved in cell wall biosynthesis
MTRIGIDARLLIYRRGIGNFVYNLLAELARLPGNEQYILYTDDMRAAQFAPQDSRFVVKKLGPKIYPLWEQVSLPLTIRRDRLDVLHCPANTAPLFLPANVKLVLTIPDVIYALPKSVLPKSPSLYQRLGRMYYRVFAQQAAKKATCVMTISEHSKYDLIKIFGVLEEKIRVVYLAANPLQQYYGEPLIVEEVMKRFAIKGKYVFALGALDPRKNTLAILNSFALLSKMCTLSPQLVIAGLTQSAKKKFSRVIDTLGIQKQVVLLGFVSEEQLAALYKGADVFVYPSLYEGFGIPILEAMECGTPVVTSSAGSIPEVAGKAALFVDPKNPEEIANAILQIVSDASLRERMIEQGVEQAKRFSWEKAAQQMLEIYRKTVEP